MHTPGNGGTGKLPRGGGSLAVTLVILLRDGRRCIGALDGTPVHLALFCWRLTKGSRVEEQHPRGETWCESDPHTPALRRRPLLPATRLCARAPRVTFSGYALLLLFCNRFRRLEKRKAEGDAWRDDGGVVLACEGLFVGRNADVGNQVYLAALLLCLFVTLSSPVGREALQ